MFKSIIVLFSLFVWSQQGPILTYEQRMKMNNECIQETGISKDFIINVVRTVKIPTNHKQYADYLTCYYKKQKFQNEDGVIVFANIKEFLENFYSSEAATFATDGCKEMRGVTDGETATLVAKCLIEKLLEIENSGSDNDTSTSDNETEHDPENNEI